MGRVTLDGFRCERCGHTWVPRATTEGDPVICPKCKSPYWNKPKLTKTMAKKFDKIDRERLR